MAFEPEFMTRFSEYSAEKSGVRTLDDWLHFKRRWFDPSDWPTLGAEQRLAESLRKRGPVRIGGRLWGYTFWTYDLTPEARYEYFATLRKIGNRFLFPDAAEDPSDNRWQHECPHCEISTNEPGEPTCPLCQRPLVATYVFE